MDNPCWGCVPPKRHAECHGSCPDYAKFAAYCAEQREERRMRSNGYADKPIADQAKKLATKSYKRKGRF